jgi:DNA integrity scanning protein DisA with diadenylate cyclase activity
MKGHYNEQTALKYKFTCRFCQVSRKLDNLLLEFNKLKTQFNVAEIETRTDVVKNIPKEIKANMDQINKLARNNQLIQFIIGFRTG